ncbi:MAG: type II toxin-antitoxin system PemK/MazF family toxin [Pseudomonadota bacterium]|nr:type II toxin-antitoxin system PemK/MazF family toxin [Pseudomonadota bacterium]
MAAGLTRGDIVMCAPPGEYGKPRPAVVLQANPFLEARNSVAVCLITSTRVDAPLFRTPIEPGETSGLDKDSFAMADKIMTLSNNRLRNRLGRLSMAESRALDAAVAQWLGLRPIS